MDIQADDIVMLENSPVEMWLEDELIHRTVLWYGVKFEGSATTGTRTGNMHMHKTLPVQSQLKGCTVAIDGTVKYLNPNDWTKYEDGTDVDTALNIMVEIPDHYIYFIADADNNVEIRMSTYGLPGYHFFKKCYVSAYEGYKDGTILRSVKDQLPTVNTTKAQFRTAARANGSEHWNQYTYKIHKALTWCFVVEYANRNSQATFNANLTEDGYHQGGLGEGVTTGAFTVNGVTTYSIVPTGVTDSLGNSTGVVEYSFTSTDDNGNDTTTRVLKVPRYRGIENPWGHTWSICDDIMFQAETADGEDKVYINDNYLTFGSALVEDYTYAGFNVPKVTAYVTQLVNNTAGDIFPDENQVAGSANTYYCDYFYAATSFTSLRMLLVGGLTGSGARAGWFYCLCAYGVSYTLSTVGSRLTYIP